MCGLVGLISRELSSTSPIQEMSRSISHRGPDDEGYVLADLINHQHHSYSSRNSSSDIQSKYQTINSYGHLPVHNLAMAQVRYSIVDLTSNGHQPMWSECGRFCITFNGEIYNYLELRHILEEEGVVFHSNTDTEVLLQAYILWDVGMFSRLNGFFAFAIYDISRKSVLLGRDRIGIAHLYLTINPNCIAWASEIKALFHVGLDVSNIDYSALADFIVHGRRDRVGTMWNDVIDFPPGHFARIGLDCKFEPICYWKFPVKRYNKGDVSFTEATSNLRNLLLDSLSLRMRADVPIGFELSGGLDSSSLVGLAAGGLGKKISTYTIKFDSEYCDEEPFARLVYQKYSHNINYNVISPPGDEFWNSANEFVWQQEEPFHAPNLRTSQVMQSLIKAHGSHAVISGAAGDEMLAGYSHDYVGGFLRHLIGKCDFVGFFESLYLSTECSPSDSLKTLFMESIMSHEKRVLIAKRKSGEYKLLQSVLSPLVLNESVHLGRINPDNSFHGRAVANMSTRMMNYWMRSGMKSAYGIPIEPRLPFLDFRVVEFLLSLPPEYLIHCGWAKYILRKAVEPFLPAEVVWRRTKMGFPFPLREWLVSSKNSVLANVVDLNCPFINLDLFVDSYDRFVLVAPLTLWRLIAVILWWRRVVMSAPIH